MFESRRFAEPLPPPVGKPVIDTSSFNEVNSKPLPLLLVADYNGKLSFIDLVYLSGQPLLFPSRLTGDHHFARNVNQSVRAQHAAPIL